MQFIDTHAHLYDTAYAADREAVIERSLQAGVIKILLPNIDSDTIEPMLQLETQYPHLFSSMTGLHPCYINENTFKELYRLEEGLKNHTFVAIGEIGIDLYRERTYQNLQEEAFAIQLTWAKQHNLPIAIHMRNAFKETIKLIEKHQDGSLHGVFHCFSGTLAEAQYIIELGFHLGIGGVITFKNAPLAQVITHIDLAHLVLETDSPYLAPTPYRGKRNEPAYLPYVAGVIAYYQQVDIATVATITTQNAKKIFNLT